MSTGTAGDPTYADRIAREVARYRDVENVHDLPGIYHYWSQGHVDPLLRELGYESLQQFLIDPIVSRANAVSGRGVRVVSLGSGNGDLELSLATSLRALGLDEFSITRLELNDSMRERARRDAEEAGLSSHFLDQSADLNSWVASTTYDVALANHSLHHVSDLEHLFEQVRTSLQPQGVFVVNDMIGRNGHMRWPEALDLLHRIWSLMPDRYRYNQQLRRHEPIYDNWDCSKEGFEGIRAQDILPLLNARFHPETFIAFANVIDLFVDRGFGHNFDVDRQDDRDFIDAVARLDEAALALGVVKPTHLLAHYRVSNVGEPRYAGVLSPEFSVRNADIDGPNRREIHDERDASGGREASANGGNRVDGSPGDSGVLGDRGAGQPKPGISKPGIPKPGEPKPGEPKPTIRFAKALAATVPPIRRLRRQRDALAAEVELLRDQLGGHR